MKIPTYQSMLSRPFLSAKKGGFLVWLFCFVVFPLFCFAQDSIAVSQNTFSSAKIYVVEGTVINNPNDNVSGEFITIQPKKKTRAKQLTTPKITQKKTVKTEEKKTKKSQTRKPRENYILVTSFPRKESLSTNLTQFYAITTSGNKTQKKQVELPVSRLSHKEIAFRTIVFTFYIEKKASYLYTSKNTTRPPPFWIV